jgi:hypothetical protein
VKCSYLEQRFASQWIVRYPELSYEREFVLPGWRLWAKEKVQLRLATRAVPMRADFAWPNAAVAVEIQGGQWVKSGHSSGGGLERDAIKAFLAFLDGWVVVSMTESMLCRHGHIWLPRLEQLIRSRASSDS